MFGRTRRLQRNGTCFHFYSIPPFLTLDTIIACSSSVKWNWTWLTVYVVSDVTCITKELQMASGTTKQKAILWSWWLFKKKKRFHIVIVGNITWISQQPLKGQGCKSQYLSCIVTVYDEGSEVIWMRRNQCQRLVEIGKTGETKFGKWGLCALCENVQDKEVAVRGRWHVTGKTGKSHYLYKVFAHQKVANTSFQYMNLY